MNPLSVLENSPLSLSEIARRSGVSRNTLHLWLRGQSQPSPATMEKVMLILGYELSLRAHRISDSDAATAARVLTEELKSSHPSVKKWIQLFIDWGDTHELHTLLESAAWASNPYGRSGAIHFLPTTPLTIASAVDASGQRWAFSGSFAQKQGAECALELRSHSTIVWCEDPSAVTPSLPSRIRQAPYPVQGGISLVPLGGEECTRQISSGGLHFVSPVQLTIDILAEAHQETMENSHDKSH
ncbi:helix-turn-helix transcriptional regulator [Corynebacterium sp. 320]|uniref:helix-turn-helix domain-containing protein n=1 Tax=Corynebacterium TaxID=1716 RepID=UPI00125CC539|nr:MULTISPECIES: helix-turn-helix transcriptional regulator [Corynebacterium]KAB1503593.1 helix-turn-helix transcriptional regulator [Corynebacterium sp. 320]KAB1553306.1 helix-turn-helix transcriptional regulator [Corynebacterium sp. 321]KAB3527729.1 helix-turn-helix transcriptional regulator [Corynebacterium sp. 250]QNP92951.1 helix-turn-helix transcriptional regulator [Corynebacterium zhongnanshanii]